MRQTTRLRARRFSPPPALRVFARPVTAAVVALLIATFAGTGARAALPGRVIVVANPALAAAVEPLRLSPAASSTVISLDDIRTWCTATDCAPETVPVYRHVGPGYFWNHADLDVTYGAAAYSDTPGLVRAYLKEMHRYPTKIAAAILVGSLESFPSVTYWDRYATDLYYADLDGKWDANGNGVLGEVFDLASNKRCFIIEGPGTPCDERSFNSYMPEIGVGRIPFDDADTAGAVATKLAALAAEAAADWRKNALFMAVSTFIQYDNWILQDLMAKQWESSGEGTTATTLFGESDEVDSSLPVHPTPDFTLPDDREVAWFAPAQQDGYGLVTWNTHGNGDTAVGVLTADEVPAVLTDDHPSVMVSFACDNLRAYEVCAYATKKSDGGTSYVDHCGWYSGEKLQVGETSTGKPVIIALAPNLGHAVMKTGAAGFLGSLETVHPGTTALGAIVGARESMEEFAAGSTLAEVHAETLRDYDLTCVDAIGLLNPCGYVNEDGSTDYDSMYKNMFTYTIYGDPLYRVVAD
ncbi:MAG: hypothetical protein HYV63_13960 [Candidatus Schekmanbacteria bacterium]|nr:hypothetical protein [Candidatus Schekmanbacteria bacterium]